MPADILIVPNKGSSTLNPAIQFSGSAANTIRLETLQSGSVAFLGNSGSLFSIVDSMSGSLMAVSDISGLPILEVFSDDRVVAGKYNSNALVVTGSRVGIGKATPNTGVALDVTGSASITGSLSVSSIFGSNALWTDISSVAYWGANPTKYGILTWDTGYATVAANTGNKLYLSANGSTSTPHITITTGGDVAINKTTANAKFDVNGNTIVTGSLVATQNITGSIISASSYMSAGSIRLGGAGGFYTLDSLGSVQISDSGDIQLRLNGVNEYAGIAFVDNSSTNYINYVGSTNTFAIGYSTQAPAVSGKRLHIHGGTSIGGGYENATVPTNGLVVQGGIVTGKSTPVNSHNDFNGNTIITGSLTVTGTITGTVQSSAPDFSPIFMIMGA